MWDPSSKPLQSTNEPASPGSGYCSPPTTQHKASYVRALFYQAHEQASLYSCLALPCPKTLRGWDRRILRSWRDDLVQPRDKWHTKTSCNLCLSLNWAPWLPGRKLVVQISPTEMSLPWRYFLSVDPYTWTTPRTVQSSLSMTSPTESQRTNYPWHAYRQDLIHRRANYTHIHMIVSIAISNS